MANMPHCRFQNTLSDLQDCYDHLFDSMLARKEGYARERIVDLCRKITAETEDWDTDNYVGELDD